MELATLLATIILGLIVAIITAWAVIENRRLRAETTHPQVQVSLESNVDLPEVAELVIANEGHGPAHHIRFQVTDGVIPRVIGKDLPIHILEDQLYYLPPGGSHRFMLGKWHEIGEETFSIETTYYVNEEEDGKKRRVKRSSNTMDPKQSKGMLRIENTERQMQKALTKFAKAAVEGNKVVVTFKDHEAEQAKFRQWRLEMLAEQEAANALAAQNTPALEAGAAETIDDVYDRITEQPEAEPDTVNVPSDDRRHGRGSMVPRNGERSAALESDPKR